MKYTILIIAAILILAVINYLRKRRIKKMEIDTPKVLMLKLGNDAEDFFEEDSNIYSSFGTSVAKFAAKNIDDVLSELSKGYQIIHLYVSLNEEGRILNFPGSKLLGELLNTLQTNGAAFTIVATDNSIAAYKMGNRSFSNKMNIVMTLDRKKGAFARYFSSFISELRRGKKISEAMAKLSPQNPVEDAPETPDTVILIINDHITFRM